MHLMYSIDAETGKRSYTLKKTTANGVLTKSAHPARKFDFFVAVIISWGKLNCVLLVRILTGR